MGYQTEATGPFGATALGYFTNATGEDGATALGRTTEASGNYGATALGAFTKAIGNDGAIAIGNRSEAYGSEGAVAIGYRTIANGDQSIVVGRYNDTLVSAGSPIGTDGPVFIVGNGTDTDERNNALVIRQNGQVEFDHYTFPIQDGNDNQVLTTNGNGQLSWANEMDGDSANEIQTISKSGNIVTLSHDGGEFKDEDDWSNVESNIHYSTGFVGVGESTPNTQLDVRAEGTRETSGIELTNGNGVFKAHIYQDNSGSLIIRKGNSPNHLVLVGGRAGISRVPSANTLEIEGPASKTVAGSWFANSDHRIKTDIQEINNATTIIGQLRPVKFKYSEEWKKRHPSIKDHYYYNFIAQEFQEIFPQAVKGSGEYLENDEDEILQIDTYNAQIVTIAAVQELIKENQVLKQEIKDIGKRLKSF